MPLTSPVWAPILLLVGVIRGANFIVLRLFLFTTLYGWAQLAGLGAHFSLAIWWARNPIQKKRANYALQNWWTNLLFMGAQRLLRLRITTTGVEALADGPFILMLRHSSLVDTLLPGVCVAIPHHFRLRYILKKELLWDPCLDFVGNTLPNYFVDRAGNAAKERASITQLAQDLREDEAVIIYPEGTRFSEKKRSRVISSLVANNSRHAAIAQDMTSVLPPRTGGALALLQANREAGVVFCAHKGLEPFANIKTLLRHGLINTTVHVHFWRVQRPEMQATFEQQQDWLFEEWKKMDHSVKRLGSN